MTLTMPLLSILLLVKRLYTTAMTVTATRELTPPVPPGWHLPWCWSHAMMMMRRNL